MGQNRKHYPITGLFIEFTEYLNFFLHYSGHILPVTPGVPDTIVSEA